MTKLQTVQSNIVTAIAAIKDAQEKPLFKTVQPVPLAGLKHSFPVCAVVISSLRRESSLWLSYMSIGIVTDSDNLTELSLAVSDALDTLIDAGSAGGFIDSPDWEFEYASDDDRTTLSFASMNMKCQLTDPS